MEKYQNGTCNLHWVETENDTVNNKKIPATLFQIKSAMQTLNHNLYPISPIQ